LSGSGSNSKVGVFGGTFDPIHLGHLAKGEEVLTALGLDQVLFVPTGQPWLKARSDITPAHHRMAMVELAIASNLSFGMSDVEIKRQGPSYSVDTLEELKRQLGPESTLYLVVGADAMKEMPLWHEPNRIFELGVLVAVSRPGSDGFDRLAPERICGSSSDQVRLIEGAQMDISGTEIRRRVSEGRSISHMVPETVEAYIYEHGLYRVGRRVERDDGEQD